MNFDVSKETIDSLRLNIEKALEKRLPENCSENSANLNEAVRYSVLGGGKRIRALLCLLTAHGFGIKDESVMHIACVLELVHAYSLIHDDLPAMDNDDLRRGKPSSHKAFGEATAILAGDTLLTMAFEWLAAAVEYGVSHSKIVELVKILSVAAGHNGMTGGQMLDMYHETTAANEKQLQTIHSLKTGALFKASVKFGAIIAEKPEATCLQLERFAQSFGLLFQITDDILDFESSAKSLGKTPGKDLASGKSTYVTLMGIENSRKYAQQAFDDCISHLSPFKESFDPVRFLSETVIKRIKSA